MSLKAIAAVKLQASGSSCSERKDATPSLAVAFQSMHSSDQIDRLWQIVCDDVLTEQVDGPIRGCILSDDCRHLLVAAGNGFIFRFEYSSTPESEDSESVDAED